MPGTGGTKPMNSPGKASSPFIRAVSGWYPYLWLSLAVWLVYAKTLHFGFLNYDEQALIIWNKAFLSNIANLPLVFMQCLTAQFPQFYRPLLMLSFMTDALAHGISPAWYHATNVILHTAAVLLLYVLLKRLACGALRSFAGALLFAVHPVLVMAIAWIPGRNDPLLAIGVFASFIMLIDYAERGKAASYFLHLAFVLFALLAKETAVSIFPAAAAYLLLVRGGIRAPEWKKLLGGWAAVAAVYAAMRVSSLAQDPALYKNVFSYAALVPRGLLGYLGKMFFPFDLTAVPFSPDVPLLPGLCAAAVLALLIFLAKNGRTGTVWFGLSWIALFFLPSISLGWQGMNFEHRSYVPLAGLCIVLGGLRGPVIGRLLAAYRGLAAALIAVILAVFAFAGFRYSDTFKDSESFWLNAVSHSPHSFLAQENLAVTYGQLGKYEPALAHFREALSLEPGNVEAQCFVGDCLYFLGRKDEAVATYRNVLNADPGNANAKKKMAFLGGDTRK